jgi:LysM repeat protein
MNQLNHQARPLGKTFTIVSILIVVALVLSVLPQFTQSAAAATCSKKYTVVAGDTLSSIAAKYNTTVQVLAQLNDLKDPYVLSVGQAICLPAGATAATATPKSSSGSSSSKYSYDMAATRDGSRITLKLNSFPAKNNYHVRIGEELRRSGWVRIGKIKTNKNGVGEATFGMPKDLRNVPSYYVCLKNQVTDKLTCKKFFQTVVNPRATARPTARPTATPKP